MSLRNESKASEESGIIRTLYQKAVNGSSDCFKTILYLKVTYKIFPNDISGAKPLLGISIRTLSWLLKKNLNLFFFLSVDELFRCIRKKFIP